MRFFLSMFSRTAKARAIPELTDFLVGNSMFRNLVIGFHNKRQTALQDLDNYLEKELINKNKRSKKIKGHIEGSTKGPNRQ